MGGKTLLIAAQASIAVMNCDDLVMGLRSGFRPNKSCAANESGAVGHVPWSPLALAVCGAVPGLVYQPDPTSEISHGLLSSQPPPHGNSLASTPFELDNLTTSNTFHHAFNVLSPLCGHRAARTRL